MEAHDELKDKVELNVSLMSSIYEEVMAAGYKVPETLLKFTLAIYNAISKEISDEYSSNVIGDALDNVGTEIRELGSKFEEFGASIAHNGLDEIRKAIELLEK